MIGAFLNWLQHSLGKGSGDTAQSWSEALLGSLNFWNLLEGTHLIALMLFAGTILVVDLRLLGMVFTRDGEVLATGAGAAALGNPAAAVAWLVRTLHTLGASLPAGSIVMTGALHAAVPVAAGETYRAEFDRLGPVTVRIV